MADKTIPAFKILRGNIGVGTTLPGSLFNVYVASQRQLDFYGGTSPSGNNYVAALKLGRGKTSNSALEIKYDSENAEHAYISRLYTNATLHFDKQGTDQMTILGDGKVGIGTVTPAAPLNVVSAYSASATTTAIKVSTVGGYNATSGVSIDFGNDQGSYATWLTGQIASRKDGGSWKGALTFSTNNDSSATDLVERMRIDGDGSVGIGTNNPGYGLDVYGTNARVGTNLRLGNGTAAGNANDPAITVSGYTNAGMYFESSGVGLGAGTGKYLFLNSSGSVGIGAATPSHKLQQDVAAGNVNFFGIRQADYILWSMGLKASDTKLYFRSGNAGSETDHVTFQIDGNVGVGTVTANSRLHIKSLTDSNSVSGITIERSANTQRGYINMGGGAFNFNVDSGLPIKFRDGGAVNMTILGDGNVGIGIENPTYKLHVSATSTTLARFDGGSANNWVSITSSDTYSAGIVYENAGTGKWYVGHYNGAPGGFSFYDASTSSVKVFIEEGGKVGIGTTDPAQLLHVYGGQIRVNQGTSGVAIGEYSNGAVIWLDGANGDFSGGDYFNIRANNSAQLTFGYAGGESVYIDSNGNVGIRAGTPNQPLEVNAYSNDKGINIGQSSGHVRVIDFTRTATHENPTARIRVSEPGATHTSNMKFYTSDASGGAPNLVERMGISSAGVISLSGSVGIGTATPGSNTPLHIYTNSASDQTILLDNDGSGMSGLKLRTDRNSDGNSTGFVIFDALNSASQDTRYATIESFIVDNSDGTEDGALRFSVMAGGNDKESMTIAAKSGHSDIGWVGIGTNTPHFPLQVYAANLSNVTVKRNFSLFDTTSAAAGTGAGIALGGYTNGTAGGTNDFGVIQGIKENGTAANTSSAMLFFTRTNGANPAEQMRISSAGSVGIGTDAPSATLDVVTSASSTVYAAEITQSNTSNGDGLYVNIGSTSSSDYVATFRSSNNNIFDIKGNGNVGVGTASPGEKLDVNGNIAMSGNTTTRTIWNKGYGGAVQLLRSDATATRWAKLGIVDASGNFVHGITVLSNGNVGIGIEAPAYPLQVYYAGGATNGMQVKGASSRAKLLVSDNDTTAYVIAEDSYASFGRNDSLTANNLNINAAGCVGIGIAAPTALLHAVASGTEICLGLKGGNDLHDNLLINGLNSSAQGVFNVRNNGNTYGTKYGFYKNGSVVGGYLELSNQAGDSDSNDVTITAAHSSNSVVLRAAQKVEMWTYAGGAYNRRVMIQNDGDVGINCTPSYKLDVAGTGRFTGILYLSSSLNIGSNTISGTPSFSSDVTISGNLGVGGSSPNSSYAMVAGSSIYVNGTVYGYSKSFLIDHPTKSDKKLCYASLEGPENGVYLRGRAQSDTITLPDYWTGLVREGTITVQLTPNGSFQHLYVVSTSLTEVKIGAADGETIDCHYTIYGERADIDRLEVEKEV